MNCKLQLGLLCTVAWDCQHCTCIKKEPGWMPHFKLLVFKIVNKHKQIEISVYINWTWAWVLCSFLTPLFPWPPTLKFKHVPFQATSLQNDGVRRSKWRSRSIYFICGLWTPHFPWPVNCKLQFDLSCTVAMRLSALYIYKKRRTLVTSLQLNETYFRYFKISVLIKKCKPNWSTSKTIGIARSQMTHAIGFMVISEICNDIGTR